MTNPEIDNLAGSEAYNAAMLGDAPESEDDLFGPPDNTADADRLLSVLRYMDSVEADVNELHAARLEELDAWRDDRLSIIEKRRAHIERLLEGWARAMHAQSGERTRTWNLPCGTLTLRQAQPRLEIDGDESLIATQLRDLLGQDVARVQYRVVKAVAKDKLKAGPHLGGYETPAGYEAHLAVTADGGLAHGVVLLVPTQPTFKATPKAPQ